VIRQNISALRQTDRREPKILRHENIARRNPIGDIQIDGLRGRVNLNDLYARLGFQPMSVRSDQQDGNMELPRGFGNFAFDRTCIRINNDFRSRRYNENPPFIER